MAITDKTLIYLDNHATTPMDPLVLKAMEPYFLTEFGNAASANHIFGHHALEAAERSRKIVAEAIGSKNTKEIIFTSGATESDNLAIHGTANMLKDKGNHIITSSIEHKAVLNTCHQLEKEGFEVTYVKPDQYGEVQLEDIEKAITKKTILITIMHANNEIGTINNLEAIGKLAAKHNIIFHSDCAQTMGKIPIDVEKMHLDLVSLSAHKYYGPKGIGALYIRKTGKSVKLCPIFFGGGQEFGLRSGTLNIPGIVGMAKATTLALENMSKEAKYIIDLRENFYKKLKDNLEEIHLNGHPTRRIPNNLNLSFKYVEGESLMLTINNIAVSTGSACSTEDLKTSYVLNEINLPEELAHCAIRFGIGRFNTAEELNYVAERIIEAVKKLRDMSPLYAMAKKGIDLKSIKWDKD